MGNSQSASAKSASSALSTPVKYHGETNLGFFNEFLIRRVFGQKAHDGNPYTAHYTEICLLQELKFKLVDGALQTNIPKTKTYQKSYAKGQKYHAVLHRELLHLAQVMGIKFDETSDFHGLVKISDEESIQLLDMAWNRNSQEEDWILSLLIKEKTGLKAMVVKLWMDEQFTIQIKTEDPEGLKAYFEALHIPFDFSVHSYKGDLSEVNLSFAQKEREPLATALRTQNPTDLLPIKIATFDNLISAIQELLEPHQAKAESNPLFAQAVLSLASIEGLEATTVSCSLGCYVGKPESVIFRFKLSEPQALKLNAYYGEACTRLAQDIFEFDLAEITKLFPRIKREMNDLAHPKVAVSSMAFASSFGLLQFQPAPANFNSPIQAVEEEKNLQPGCGLG